MKFILNNAKRKRCSKPVLKDPFDCAADPNPESELNISLRIADFNAKTFLVDMLPFDLCEKRIQESKFADPTEFKHCRKDL